MLGGGACGLEGDAEPRPGVCGTRIGSGEAKWVSRGTGTGDRRRFFRCITFGVPGVVGRVGVVGIGEVSRSRQSSGELGGAGVRAVFRPLDGAGVAAGGGTWSRGGGERSTRLNAASSVASVDRGDGGGELSGLIGPNKSSISRSSREPAASSTSAGWAAGLVGGWSRDGAVGRRAFTSGNPTGRIFWREDFAGCRRVTSGAGSIGRFFVGSGVGFMF